jgi:hypothetical protein
VAQPQMMTSTAPGGPSNAAKFGQLAGGWIGRVTAGRGFTPFRLRAALVATILFAVVFAVLGAYGVGKRQSSIDAANHAAGQLLQVQLDVVEVGAQGAPAVDDEVHVAVPVVDPALGPPGAVGLDRVDALSPEVRLATVDDARHLGDDPADDVGLGAAADAGDVGEPGHR